MKDSAASSHSTPTSNISTAYWDTTTATTGDPQGKTPAAIIQAIIEARNIGCYIGINYHTGSPKFTLGSNTYFLSGQGQPPFLPYDTAYNYWINPSTAIPYFIALNLGSAALNTKLGINGGAAGVNYNPAFGGPSGIDDIVWELFNEPYLTSQAWTLTTLNSDGTNSGTLAPNTPGATWSPYVPNVEYVMLNGGWCNWYYDQNSGEIPTTFTSPANTNTPTSSGGSVGGGALNLPWRILGYQQIVTALRNAGFTNIIACNTTNFTSTVSSFPYICPVDPLNKIATSLHNYPTAYNSASAVPGSGDQQSTWHYSLDQMIAGTLPYTAPSWTTGWIAGRSVPIFNNEFGDVSGPSSNGIRTVSAPTQLITAYADAAPLGSYHVCPFSWNGPNTATSTGSSNSNGAPGYAWFLSAFLAPVSVTAGIAGTTMTVTAISGGGTPLLSGMQMLSGTEQDSTPTYQQTLGTWIRKQLTQTNGDAAGGRGTYQVSVSQTVANGTTIKLAFPAAWNGFGTTVANWMQPHS